MAAQVPCTRSRGSLHHHVRCDDAPHVPGHRRAHRPLQRPRPDAPPRPRRAAAVVRGRARGRRARRVRLRPHHPRTLAGEAAARGRPRRRAGAAEGHRTPVRGRARGDAHRTVLLQLLLRRVRRRRVRGHGGVHQRARRREGLGAAARRGPQRAGGPAGRRAGACPGPRRSPPCWCARPTRSGWTSAPGSATWTPTGTSTTSRSRAGTSTRSPSCTSTSSATPPAGRSTASPPARCASTTSPRCSTRRSTSCASAWSSSTRRRSATPAACSTVHAASVWPRRRAGCRPTRTRSWASAWPRSPCALTCARLTRPRHSSPRHVSVTPAPRHLGEGALGRRPGRRPRRASSSTVVAKPACAASSAVARTQWSVAMPRDVDGGHPACGEPRAQRRSARLGALEPGVRRRVVALVEDRLDARDVQVGVERGARGARPAVRRPRVDVVRGVGEVRRRGRRGGRGWRRRGRSRPPGCARRPRRPPRRRR